MSSMHDKMLLTCASVTCSGAILVAMRIRHIQLLGLL